MAPVGYFRFSMVVTAVLAAALTALLVLDASPVSASAVPGTTLVVDTKADESNADGDCSMREAVEAANANAAIDACKAGSATERDAIHFSLGRKATIVLGSSLPIITDPSGLTIDGRRAKITVSGNDAVRVFEVGSGAKLTLARLTVADGNSGSFGGGVFNNGTVEVFKSKFSGNKAFDTGGGIDNRGTLTVVSSAFSDNRTTRTDGNNFGGGIFNVGTTEVFRSTFSGNSSLQGGGVANFGTLTATNSTFSGNIGAAGGGILNNDGATLTVVSSTFSANSSTQLAGGAIRQQPPIGPFDDGGTTTLRNTIAANSPSGGNCSGTIADGGFNMDDGTSCGFSAANDSMPSTDPLLADSLANNGGSTKTIALLPSSPAIDAIPQGANDCGTEIATDQRGVGRPQGSGCDTGAFEKEQRR